MADFWLALENCNLNDMGYTRAKFIWSSCQSDGDFIKERLDRVVGNTEWRALFLDVEV
jgi:hypothetical protein